jgi:hypothetical protein
VVEVNLQIEFLPSIRLREESLEDVLWIFDGPPLGFEKDVQRAFP